MFEQGHTSGFGEFGVQTKYLDRECDLVDDALAGGLFFRPKFKVVDFVVQAVTVFVVHVFAFVQRATQVLRHENTVLKVFASASEMKSPIAARMNVAVLVYGSPLATFVTALDAAKAVFVAKTRQASVFVLQTLTFCGRSTICTLEGGRVHAFGHEAHYTTVMAL